MDERILDAVKTGYRSAEGVMISTLKAYIYNSLTRTRSPDLIGIRRGTEVHSYDVYMHQEGADIVDLDGQIKRAEGIICTSEKAPELITSAQNIVQTEKPELIRFRQIVGASPPEYAFYTA